MAHAGAQQDAMRGLELSHAYWLEEGRPALAAACPEAAGVWSAGLAGEGSECFGLDDDLSRDHDWGPGFCVWLDEEEFARYGARLQEAYDALPKEFRGHVRHERPEGRRRVGILRTEDFFERFCGLRTPPRTVGQWMALDDEALAVCVNGTVFEDGAPGFKAFRDELSAYYPRDIALKKLAAHCALAGQAGQYNYPRCVERGDAVAALGALGRFIEHAQAIAFALNRRYRPYYKLAQRALARLPLLGAQLAPRLAGLAEGDLLGKRDDVEAVCGMLAQALREADLGGADLLDDYLVAHARRIQGGVHNDGLRALPLMALKL